MKGLYKIALTLQGYPIKQACNDWQNFNRLSNKDRLQSLECKRNEIVNYFIKHSKPYSELLNDWDGKWDDIPVMTKSFLRTKGEKLISDQYKIGQLHKAATSGSSGFPLVIYRDKYGHAMTWAYIIESMRKFGINYGDDCQGRFYGFPDRGVSSIINAKLKNILANRIIFPCKKMSDIDMEIYLSKIINKNITYLYGYTSSLLLFCDFLKRKKIGTLHSICPKLKCVFFTSEVCLPNEQEEMKLIFGIPVIGEYGAIDIGLIGYQQENNTYEVNDGQIYLEVVDENNNILNDGCEGKLLVTALYNHAIPIIRYELGDRGTLGYNNGKRIIHNLGGRLSEYILKRDGTKIPFLSTYNAAKKAAMKFPQIIEYYTKQIDYETIIFEIVLSEGEITNQIRNEFSNSLKQCLGNEYNIEVVKSNNIKRTEAGKMKRFESQIL